MKFTEDNYVTKKGHIRYLEELKELAIENRKIQPMQNILYGDI